MAASCSCENDTQTLKVNSPLTSAVNQVDLDPTETTQGEMSSEFLLLNTATHTVTKAKSVSFSDVTIRHYERILEINPAVTSGAAIGIGWRYNGGGTISVEDWEHRRSRSRRSAHELLLPRQVRDIMLEHELGYSQKEIAKATRIIRKVKDRRRVTVENLSQPGVAKLEQKVEKVSRAIKGLLRICRKTSRVAQE